MEGNNRVVGLLSEIDTTKAWVGGVRHVMLESARLRNVPTDMGSTHVILGALHLASSSFAVPLQRTHTAMFEELLNKWCDWVDCVIGAAIEAYTEDSLAKACDIARRVSDEAIVWRAVSAYCERAEREAARYGGQTA